MSAAGNPSKMNLPALNQQPCVYRSRRFSVHTAALTAHDGRTIERDAVRTPNAVTVLPLLDDDHVVMIRNARFAVGEVLWELCAGVMEPSETDPLVCAKREVIEETGYHANDWRKLCSFFSMPGLATERMHAFVCRDLEHVGQNLDENEQIEVEVLPMEKTMQMVRDGDIRDAKTIATLLYYQMFARNHDS